MLGNAGGMGRTCAGQRKAEHQAGPKRIKRKPGRRKKLHHRPIAQPRPAVKPGFKAVDKSVERRGHWRNQNGSTRTIQLRVCAIAI